jgi:plasmid stabilization system protein ParE
MNYTVVVTERAGREIEDATTWWARNRSAEQAEHWYLEIRLAIAYLANFPERYQLAAESAELEYELRELLFGLGRRMTHRILFTIRGDRVYVLTVRHAARDRIRPEDLA